MNDVLKHCPNKVLRDTSCSLASFMLAASVITNNMVIGCVCFFTLADFSSFLAGQYRFFFVCFFHLFIYFCNLIHGQATKRMPAAYASNIDGLDLL